MVMGHLERVGALLDQATALIPHRAEPLMMSINLAQKTHDPKRMGDAVEALLSLGWPGNDEGIRRDARKQVETLVKWLREEGRGRRGRRPPGASPRHRGARRVHSNELAR